MDILFQYDTNTNILPLQPQLPLGIVLTQGSLDSHVDRSLHSLSPIQPNIDLIDQFIDSLMLSHNLKALATFLR